MPLLKVILWNKIPSVHIGWIQNYYNYKTIIWYKMDSNMHVHHIRTNRDMINKYIYMHEQISMWIWILYHLSFAIPWHMKYIRYFRKFHFNLGRVWLKRASHITSLIGIFFLALKCQIPNSICFVQPLCWGPSKFLPLLGRQCKKNRWSLTTQSREWLPSYHVWI